MFKSETILAVAAMLSTAKAFGNFAVINKCDFDIYLWSVEAGPGASPAPMITLPANRPDIGYMETYRIPPNLAGISLKASPNYGPGNSVPSDKVTQLEYTVPLQNDQHTASVKNLIFYDLSWVNGNVFEGIALTMQTSTGNGPNPCAHGTCGIGQSCDIGYQWSTDDTKTHACDINANILWTFCSQPGGNLQSPKGLLSKREAEPEAIAAPAPAPESDAEGLAVCIDINNPKGPAQECPEDDPVPAPAPAPAPTTTSSTKPVVTSAAPIVALAKPSSAPPPAPSSSSSPPAPVASAPVPISNPSGGPVSMLALTDIEACGVQTWLTYNGGHYKRELSEHSAHRHNHAQFHRRSRITRNSARA